MADGDSGGAPGPSTYISNNPPNATDLKMNDSLMQELKARNNFETEEGTERREKVLARLQTIVEELVQKVGKQKGLPQSILQEAGGKIFPYGSYLLGIHGPGSDMDILMAAPKHVSREDFFEHTPDLLRKYALPGEITHLTPVPGISVPIIKLMLLGVEIDLIFACLRISAVPITLELTDNDLLRGLDEHDLRSVNGPRCGRKVLQLIPQSRVFRIATRAIKLWAQERAIYGNVMGYPGGIAYVIMVARVCQLYPKAAASLIVHKFFWLMKTWKWSDIDLTLQPKENVSLQLQQFGDRPWDKAAVMPVLTPAYPMQNTNHNIGRSSMAIMMRELSRGEEITSMIYQGKTHWKALFARHSFFTDSYKHYLSVVAAGKSKEAMDAWSGRVQSKLMRLISGIEFSDANSVDLVQLWNKGLERVHECKSQAEIEQTLQGGLECQVLPTKTTDPSVDVKVQATAQDDADSPEVAASAGVVDQLSDGTTKIWTKTFYMGIGLAKGANNLDISRPIHEFKGTCCDWEQYDSDVHSLNIKHLRSYQLPDDVFKPGEVKPAKKKNKTAKPPAQAVDKKRSVTSAGLDDDRDAIKRRQSNIHPGAGGATNGASKSNGSAG